MYNTLNNNMYTIVHICTIATPNKWNVNVMNYDELGVYLFGGCSTYANFILFFLCVIFFYYVLYNSMYT